MNSVPRSTRASRVCFGALAETILGKKFVAARRRNQTRWTRALPNRYTVELPSPAPNSIPCASGSSLEKLIVFV